MNAAVALLTVLSGAVAVCAHQLALGVWRVCVYVGAPCALAWAAQVGWRWFLDGQDEIQRLREAEGRVRPEREFEEEERLKRELERM